MKKSIAEKFTNVVPVTKTVQFKLIPIGKTRENMTEYEVIEKGEQLHENWQEMKSAITTYDRFIIEDVLKNKHLDVTSYYETYIKQHTDADLEKVAIDCRKKIASWFANDGRYNAKFIAFINNMRVHFSDSPDIIALLDIFKNKSELVSGFNNNRLFMFEADKKIGSIPYRIINYNLPIFINNILIYQKAILKDEIKSGITPLLEELGVELSSFFDIKEYDKMMIQDGIDLYNTVIGGISKEDEVKIQGLNELINLYNQSHKGEDGFKRLPSLKQLGKQILFEHTTKSFVNKKFETDFDVFSAIDEICKTVFDEIIHPEEIQDDSVSICRLIGTIGEYDTNGIFVSANQLSCISNSLYGNYDLIESAFREYYDDVSAVKNKATKKYEATKRKYFKNKKEYSIAEINDVTSKYIKNYVPVENYFEEKIKESIEKIPFAFQVYKNINRDKYTEKKSLKNSNNDIGIIEKLFDCFQEIKWTLKSFANGINNPDKDEVFYCIFSEMWDIMRSAGRLYERIQTYVTGKDYVKETININFDNSNLLRGWSIGKEADSGSFIFRKDGLYYLGLINKKAGSHVIKVVLDSIRKDAISNDYYEKMNYLAIPDAAKYLPFTCFAQKNEAMFHPNDHIKDIRARQIYNKQANELNKNKSAEEEKIPLKGISWQEQVDLIGFYSNCLCNSDYPHWKDYGFSLKKPEEYTGLNEFYTDVTEQAYLLSFSRVDASTINSLIDKGYLFFFQIYNHDFSPYSKGKKDLYTLYFEEIFSKNATIKLCGEGEIRYRPKSNFNPIVHPAGTPIDNKTPNAKKKQSVFPFDIVKDRRFTEESFELHIPLKFNWKKPTIKDKPLTYKMNEIVRDELRKEDEVYVIGIDRGCTNLAYITVIDLYGNIIIQESLNTLDGIDYVAKFDGIYDEFKNSKLKICKDNRLKDVRKGYSGKLVHHVIELIDSLGGLPIIAIEKIDEKFKRKLSAIDNQAFQRIEKALFDKFKYVVYKTKNDIEPGSAKNGLQLAGPYLPNEKFWQSGIMFYVNPAYTSKIDPVTGFVSLFNKTDLLKDNMKTTKDLIGRLKSIRYHATKNMYSFEFDYRDFGIEEDCRNIWEIWSNGSRSVYSKQEKKTHWYDLTEEFTKLFEEYNVNISALNLKDCILGVESAKFYNMFLKLFKMMVQMRNIDKEKNIDEIISPVKDRNGNFFHSGNVENMPINADANGSYCIALKALLGIKNIKDASDDEYMKVNTVVDLRTWLSIMQNKDMTGSSFLHKKQSLQPTA